MITADNFMGLTKKRAQDLAEAKSMIFRLISIDGDSFLPYPEMTDKREDRICVEIENSKVIKAIIQ